MNTKLSGRAWVFPGPITTDHILPGQYLDRTNEEVGRFAMAGIDDTFTNSLAQGDFVVSGRNFGGGSGRENAVTALKYAGVGAVIAESFGRVFFRNCINHGLIAVVIDTTDGIDTGDSLEVDLRDHMVRNLTNGSMRGILNLKGTALAILEAGGIVAYTKQHLTQGS